MTDIQRTRIIRKEIQKSYQLFRKKYPILNHQNAIGFTIFIVCLLAATMLGYLWWIDSISLFFLIVGNAFLFGILHELEHDLIHWMYFKENKWIHHTMLLLIWLARPLTINPWIRRIFHYHHHSFSGTLHDVEERGVTNGEKWTWKRLLFTPDLVIGNLLRVRKLFEDISSEVQKGHLSLDTGNQLKKYGILALIPITIISHVILYAFTIECFLGVLRTFFEWNIQLPLWISSTLDTLKPLIYIVLLPNLLRQFCLHLITSNLHYFGDVEKGNVMQQTQIVNAWWTFPLQIFCFFFGWTHAIHHFVVNETFYIRHFTRKKAHQIMKEYGVRFNDFASMKRANRYHPVQE